MRYKFLVVLLSGFAVAFVVRVIDGDTVVVQYDNGVEDTVRLIGIDAPERGEPGADEAAEFLTGLILYQVIWIETDVEPRDIYNRALGYIWLDGEVVNLQLVEEGYAVPFEYPPNTKYAELIGGN